MQKVVHAGIVVRAHKEKASIQRKEHQKLHDAACKILLQKVKRAFLMGPNNNPGVNYFLHHSLPIFIYGMLVLSLLSGKGFLARFFCIGIVRKIGRASFYPYLIHLPIITMAWGFCNLNTPANTVKMLIFIYTISTLYMEFKIWRKKRKKAKIARLRES